MPALESNLMILFAVLAALCVAGAVVRALWQPVLRRVWRYFVAWWERDARAEKEARLMRAARERAEAEVRECVHEDALESVNSTSPQSMPSPKHPHVEQAVTRRNVQASAESAQRVRADVPEDIQRTLRN